jgi:hypothetical protein
MTIFLVETGKSEIDIVIVYADLILDMIKWWGRIHVNDPN